MSARRILVGSAQINAEVARLVGEFQRDAQIVIRKPPVLEDAEDILIDLGNCKSRRSSSSKKYRIKGVRP